MCINLIRISSVFTFYMRNNLSAKLLDYLDYPFVTYTNWKTCCRTLLSHKAYKSHSKDINSVKIEFFMFLIRYKKRC